MQKSIVSKMNVFFCFCFFVFFAFYAEIQDGHQKWRENDFWEKPPVDSADTVGYKNFLEISLSRTESKTNAFYTEI